MYYNYKSKLFLLRLAIYDSKLKKKWLSVKQGVDCILVFIDCGINLNAKNHSIFVKISQNFN